VFRGAYEQTISIGTSSISRRFHWYKNQAGLLAQYHHPFSLPDKLSGTLEWTPHYSGGTARGFHPTSLLTKTTKNVFRHLIFTIFNFCEQT